MNLHHYLYETRFAEWCRKVWERLGGRGHFVVDITQSACPWLTNGYYSNFDKLKLAMVAAHDWSRQFPGAIVQVRRENYHLLVKADEYLRSVDFQYSRKRPNFPLNGLEPVALVVSNPD